MAGVDQTPGERRPSFTNRVGRNAKSRNVDLAQRKKEKFAKTANKTKNTTEQKNRHRKGQYVRSHSYRGWWNLESSERPTDDKDYAKRL